MSANMRTSNLPAPTGMTNTVTRDLHERTDHGTPDHHVMRDHGRTDHATTGDPHVMTDLHERTYHVRLDLLVRIGSLMND